MGMKDKKLTALIICAIIAGMAGSCMADATSDNTSEEAQKILDDISQQEAIYFPTQYTIKEIDTRYQVISMYAVPTIERPPVKNEDYTLVTKYGGPVQSDNNKKKRFKKKAGKIEKAPMLRYAPPMRMDK